MEKKRRVEEIVMERAEIQNAPVAPRLFVDFLEKLAPKLTLLPAVLTTLQLFENHDVRLAKISEAFEAHPGNSAAFIKFIRLNRVLEEVDSRSLEQTIPRYGLDSARDLVLCIALHETIQKKPFPWNAQTSRPDIEPRSMIPFALDCAASLGEGNRYAHQVFAAGLVFDSLRLYAEANLGEQKKPVIDYITRVFRHGKSTAQVFLALSKQMKTLELAEFALATAVLHDVGKAVMAVLSPDYVGFVTQLEREKITRSLKVYAEEKRYGVSHSLFGYLACGTYPMFRPIARAVMYHHDPYVLDATREAPLRDLANTVSLATNIAQSNLKLPSDSSIQVKYKSDQDQEAAKKLTEESVKKLWMRPELENHELSPTKIHQIIQELKKS